MTQAHYIEWICLESEHSIQYAHLSPDDEPTAKYAICEGDEVRAVVINTIFGGIKLCL